MMADVLVLGAVGADHVGGDLGARPHKVTNTFAIVHRVQINPRTSVMHAYIYESDDIILFTFWRILGCPWLVPSFHQPARHHSC